MNLGRMTARQKLILGSGLVLLAGGACTGIIVANAGAGTSPPAPTAAEEEVSQLCNSASAQVIGGTASGFMQWINQQCTSEGASALAAQAASPPAGIDMSSNAGHPVASLICEYAYDQIQAGTATKYDQTQYTICQMPAATSPTGIVPVEELPPGITRSISYAATNAWTGEVNGLNVAVYAGAQPATLPDGTSGDSNRGEVLVLSLQTGKVQVYLTSADSGALTIESVSGSTLSLKSAKGATYSFDAASDTLSEQP